MIKRFSLAIILVSIGPFSATTTTFAAPYKCTLINMTDGDSELGNFMVDPSVSGDLGALEVDANNAIYAACTGQQDATSLEWHLACGYVNAAAVGKLLRGQSMRDVEPIAFGGAPDGTREVWAYMPYLGVEYRIHCYLQ